MPNYTLFIDESGDFITKRGEWLLGGIIFEGSYDQIINQLNNKFSLLLKNGDIKKIEDYHLTEIRCKYGANYASNVATNLLNKIDELEINYSFLIVLNEYKKNYLQEREHIDQCL